MSHKSPNLIVSSTDHYSAIADAIVGLVDNPKITKNTVLNVIAKELVGGKTNWGGLKALPSPVFATGLDANALSRHDQGVAPLEATDQYWFKRHAIGFNIPHPQGPFTIWLDAIEVPILEQSIRTSRGYETQSLIFEVHRGTLHVISKTKKQAGTLEIPCGEFLEFVASQKEALLNYICTHGAGEAIHDAFVEESQSDGEVRLTQVAHSFPALTERIRQESIAKIQRRISEAIRQVTWTWIAGGAFNTWRRKAILDDNLTVVAKTIMEYDHPMIDEEMEKMLEEEAGADRNALLKTISPDIYHEGIVTRSVLDLRPGDRVDLEGDPYADPDGEGNPTFQHEYQIVESVELETPHCVLVHFESWDACGFPVKHRVQVDAEQVLPIYIFKNMEILDGSGQIEYMTLTRSGDVHESLVMTPTEAQEYIEQMRLDVISPARVMNIRLAAKKAKPLT